MFHLRQWFLDLLLKHPSHRLALEREAESLSLLQDCRRLLKEQSDRRLTLEDLQLTPGEQVTLQSATPAFRAAAHKADEHFCLTAIPECCRQTAVRIREYHRTLTLTPQNKVPHLDDTPADQAEARMKQYFRKRYGDS